MPDPNQNSDAELDTAALPSLSPPIRFDDEVEDQDPPVEMPQGFSVVDQGTANWLVRTIVEARAYRQRVEAWAAREIRRAEREETFLLRAFGRGLEAWAQGEINKFKGRRQSINLPAGAVGFRRQGPKLVITDDAAVIVWAQKNLPAAVATTTTEQLRKSVLTDHFEKTGEIPAAGAHVEPEAQKFFIR